MKTSKPRFIYYVFGDNGVIRYVGCSVEPRHRLGEHRALAKMQEEAGKQTICPFYRWLNVERMRGGGVHHCIVRPASTDHARDEQAEITRLADAGVILLNVETTDAGKTKRQRPGKSEGVPKSKAAVELYHFEVTEAEHAELKARAGPAGIAAMIRAMLGLPPRERGRPKSAPPPPQPARRPPTKKGR